MSFLGNLLRPKSRRAFGGLAWSQFVQISGRAVTIPRGRIETLLAGQRDLVSVLGLLSDILSGRFG